MKNKMKKAACGFMAAAVCLSGCGKLDGTQTVLTVNDSTLTLGTANVALRYQQSQMYSYYSQMYAMYGMAMDELWDTEVEESTASEASEASETSEASEASGSSVAEEAEDTGTGKTTTYGEQFKDSCMDGLTDMLLLAEHMGEYGVEFTEEDQAAAEDAAAAFVEANDGDILEADGITAEDVAEYLRLLTIKDRMFDPMVADVDTEVSDEEAKQSTITYISVLNSTYETDSDEEDADTEETEEEKEEKSAAAKAQAKEVAENIYDAVKNSPADAELKDVVAAIDADATVSTSTYGSTESSTGLDEAVREAADTLSDGEFYDGVIELDNSYWIIRMDAVVDREATDKEKENIVSTRKTELYQDILEGWRDAASTTVNTSVWKKVKVTDSVVYTIKAAESTEE